MFSPKQKQRLAYWSMELLVLSAIVWLGTRVSFLFSPIETFFSAIFVPTLIAGALFYLFNPVIKLMMKIPFGKHHLSRTSSVATLFIVLAFLIYLICTALIPQLISQLSHLVTDLPHLTKQMEAFLNQWSRHGWIRHLPVRSYITNVEGYVQANLRHIIAGFSSQVFNIFSIATNLVINIITIPVMLFFMLKDGNRLEPNLMKLIPKNKQKRTSELLHRMSHTISKYIDGQLIECLFVGVFTTLGYLLINQNYAIILGLFAGCCNIIPYVGPYIGIAPSLIIAMASGMPMVFAVIIVVIIVQQIDGNFIYPNVIGKTLQIHPLTIIIILLAAGHIAGIAGMILAIPLYAVVKTVVQYGYGIIQNNRKAKNED